MPTQSEIADASATGSEPADASRPDSLGNEYASWAFRLYRLTPEKETLIVSRRVTLATAQGIIDWLEKVAPEFGGTAEEGKRSG